MGNSATVPATDARPTGTVALSRRRRLIAASGAVATTLGLGIVLVLGLRVMGPDTPADEPVRLDAFELASAVPPMPPKPNAPMAAQPRPAIPLTQSAPAAAAAAPPTLTVAPTAEIARPVIDLSATATGVATLDARGTGADDTGSGSGGGADGTGGDGDIAQRARQTDGFITLADYPLAARKAGAQGTANVRYTVLPTGRADACEVVRSSGSTVLDDLTCRLVVRRFVFRPALDRAGRKVAERRSDRFAWRLAN